MCRGSLVICLAARTRNLGIRSLPKATVVVLALLLALALLTDFNFRRFDQDEDVIGIDTGSSRFTYSQQSPLIFIGGFPRSGTTLMRAMLDAHPDVRCGQETRIIPRMVFFRQHLYTPFEKKRLNEAGITEQILDSAMSSFILHIMVHHGEAAPRICNKDPFLMLEGKYMSKVFPRAKFLFMVRDGRASIYSAITRNISLDGYNLSNPRSCLREWSKDMSKMYNECQAVGSDHCMMVHYEQLILHPTHWAREILSFLDLPWDDAVLHHEQNINKVGGVPLSRLEWSSEQIIKPVNVEALYKWVGFYPRDVLADMASIAPMLATLGYDPDANPPNYGTPDDSVIENTKMVQNQVDYWTERAKHLHLKH